MFLQKQNGWLLSQHGSTSWDNPGSISWWYARKLEGKNNLRLGTKIQSTGSIHPSLLRLMCWHNQHPATSDISAAFFSVPMVVDVTLPGEREGLAGSITSGLPHELNKWSITSGLPVLYLINQWARMKWWFTLITSLDPLRLSGFCHCQKKTPENLVLLSCGKLYCNYQSEWTQNGRMYEPSDFLTVSWLAAMWGN